VKIRALAAGAAVSVTAALLTLGPAAGPEATALPDAAATPDPAAQRTTTGFTGTTVRMRLRRAVTRLPVATETRRGYDRDKFQHWIDADDDCQDTRDEVLDAESLSDVSGCDITTGKWRSYYDGVVWTDAADVDIDHLVPLAEAWDSGARGWTAGTRTRYANDLRDPRPLVAVTDNVNQSKSDQDPAEWMPELGKCRYVREWVAVKIRWQLTVNRPEKQALRSWAENCKNTFVKVRRATVVHTNRVKPAHRPAGRSTPTSGGRAGSPGSLPQSSYIGLREPIGHLMSLRITQYEMAAERTMSTSMSSNPAQLPWPGRAVLAPKRPATKVGTRISPVTLPR